MNYSLDLNMSYICKILKFRLRENSKSLMCLLLLKMNYVLLGLLVLMWWELNKLLY